MQLSINSLLQVGGGEDRDDAFLLDLLVTLYEDEVPTIEALVEAGRRYRQEGDLSLQDSRFRELEHEGPLEKVRFVEPVMRARLVHRNSVNTMHGSQTSCII